MTTPAQRLAAWGVHAFTLSGLLFAVLAVLALIDGEIAMMWLWLGIAMAVDAVDGTLARKAEVKRRVPWFDGGTVDIVVDCLTWTFIPALFMYLHLPWGGGPLPAVLLVVVLVSSMFCYANEGWKSADYYFVGFPAAWNIVAVTLWVLQTDDVVNVAVTLLLAVLTLVPTHYTHPFRVRRFMALNILAITAWTVSAGWLVAVHPMQPTWLFVMFWTTGAWFLLTCLWRTMAGAHRGAKATDSVDEERTAACCGAERTAVTTSIPQSTRTSAQDRRAESRPSR